MTISIDQSVYPDCDPPANFDAIEDRAEYLHRICSAWDFGVHPSQTTFQLFSAWLDVFDRFPVLTSPAYHAFRSWFGWPRLEAPAGLPIHTPQWEHLDRLEGRELDPCLRMI